MADGITFNMDAAGIWAWLAQNSVSIRKAKLKALVKIAHRETWRAWMNAPDRSNYGMRMRFTERAFSLLSLTPRSESYRNRQRLNLGKVLPFVSPVGGMARSTHTYRRITVEGTGWNPRTRGTSELRTRAALPGAATINRMGGRSGIYRQEFYNVNRGAADVKFLEETSVAKVTDNYLALIRESRKSTMKVAG